MLFRTSHSLLRRASVSCPLPLAQRWRHAGPALAYPHVTARPALAVRSQHSLKCPHFERCSGCTEQDTARPPLLADAVKLAERLGMQDFNYNAGTPHGWRCRARLAVRGRPHEPVIGLFRASTHDAINIPQCRVHHPRINAAVEAIRNSMQYFNIKPYEERSHRGELRYVQLTAVGTQAERPAAQDDPAAGVQVVLVWNEKAPKSGTEPPLRLRQLAHRLWRQHGPGSAALPLVHSVWANYNTSGTNTILGAVWQLLEGEEQLTRQVLGGAVAAFAPGSFMQANFGQMEAALAAMQPFVPEGSRVRNVLITPSPKGEVLDLHAGVGVIGLSLAATRRCQWVRAVDVNPQGQAPFEAAARDLTAKGRETEFEYRVSVAGAAARGGWFAGADIIVVDPPRKGLEQELLQLLTADADGQLQCTAHTLIYLSCGVPSFRANLEILLDSGRWSCIHYEAFQFFPGSNHLECLAVLRRQT